MSKFKDRLWSEIVREHGGELAQLTKPVARRGRRARPRLLAGTSVGIAGLGTALTLVLSAASSAPAFAVTSNRDGTVQVLIARLSGISGANDKLASLGIRARIVEVLPGCKAVISSDANRPTGVAISPTVVRSGWVAAPAVAQVRLDPRRIPLGRVLVLPTALRGQLIHIASGRWVRGAPPPCLPPLLLPMTLKPGNGRGVQCVAGGPPRQFRSGNRGNGGSGAGSAGKGRPPLVTSIATGNSGTSGNSGGPETSSGPPPAPNSGPPPDWALVHCRVIDQPPPGKPGATGNSGNSGNS